MELFQITLPAFNSTDTHKQLGVWERGHKRERGGGALLEVHVVQQDWPNNKISYFNLDYVQLVGKERGPTVAPASTKT